MGFWKFFPFLALSILVLYQVGVLQAALFSVTVQKRACHFSTCMVANLADYLSKAARKNKSVEDILPESMRGRRRDLQF